jgi:ubiquinone/menaquinone biosynthesis C-methylase UbiE
MFGPQICFDDGAAYEQMMGVWSQLAGKVFLEWLAPSWGLRWIDIGCGGGAFTELLVKHCNPAEVQGIDPSEGQLAFARARLAAPLTKFRQGDAMALPFPAHRFDAAVMALVLVFVSDPSKSIEEMARVVAPGGTVATYVWDMLSGGNPLDPILDEIRAMGHTPPRPPQMDASRKDELRDLWVGVGLEAVETRTITVQRTFADFDDFWMAKVRAPTIAPTVAAMGSGEIATLKRRLRVRLPADAAGRITYGARAHAIKGRVRPWPE